MDKNYVIIQRKKTKRYKWIVNYITFSIPITIFFDWLFNLEIISTPIGLVVKSISIIVFSYFLISKSKKVVGFTFKNVLIYFLLLNFIYALFSDEFVQNIYFSIRIVYWIFGTISIYFLYSNNLFSLNKIHLMIVSTVIFASIFTLILMKNSEEHQNASAYLLLWCMPILLFFKQTKILRLVQIIAIISIMMTIKRGAILALIISIVFYIIGMFRVNKTIIKKTKILIVGVVLLGFASLVISLNWNAFSVRLEDKGGSGRDKMYDAIIDSYINSSAIELIFGHGINSVQKFTNRLYNGIYSSEATGVAAHSDWLQYMYDFGFLGILFMLLLHYKFLMLIIINFKQKSDVYPILLMTYSIFFFTTIYSFILNTPDALFLGITIAVISVETRNFKNIKYYVEY